MSQIAELTKIISERTQELEESTEQAIESELEKLKDATKKHCESVESELQSAMQNQLKIIKYMTLSIAGAWLTLLIVMAIGTWALTVFYIKPMELKTQMSQRMDLEKSGLLLKGQDGNLVVMPPETSCWKNEELNKKVCRLPD